MALLSSFKTYSSIWFKESTRSKTTILVSLILLIIAYLPSLQFDYVTQDQWRAFRYSTPANISKFRVQSCITGIWRSYTQSGRPLVWPTECVEHKIVSKISDFSRVRPYLLIIVLLTAVYLGYVLAPIVGNLAMGVVTASIFLLTPGYAFMYLQGLTAAMVLLSILFAAASFHCLSRWINTVGAQNYQMKLLVAPILLFLTSCYIYPAWSFIVIILAWTTFGFDNQSTWPAKIKSLVLTLIFYMVAAIIYYLSVK